MFPAKFRVIDHGDRKRGFYPKLQNHYSTNAQRHTALQHSAMRPLMKPCYNAYFVVCSLKQYLYQ